MTHLSRTLALGGWVLLGTWVGPRMGTSALEIAREQLQIEDARAGSEPVEALPTHEAAVPVERAPKRPAAPAKVPAPVDASAGARI